VLLIVAAGWGVAWLAQSPLFSVASIEITGAEHAAVGDVLADHDVYRGRPLVLIRSGAVADALELDPWVREASVSRIFPDRITIQIVERTEVAVVPATDGWSTVSDDGRVMVNVPDPPAGLLRVSPAVAVAAPGGDWVSERMLGVVEFASALPADMRAGTEITAEAGELIAAFDGHRIRLGTEDHMRAKAVALVAVLADPRLPADAVIDLIAPSRPAIRAPATNPQSLLEGEDNALEEVRGGG
jgi:cell division protein FtsQ